jgi:hypothetical protein
MDVARALAAVVAALVFVGCAAPVGPPGASSPASGTAAASPSATPAPVRGLTEPSDGTAPAGWRLESSLGVEVVVPATWSVNDYGCPMSGRPTIEHWKSDERDCGRGEPRTMDVAVIYEDGFGYDERDRTLRSRTILIGGASATRAEGRIADGRYEAWVVVPSYWPVVVVARNRDADTARRIVDSVRLVDPDHNGCRLLRPARPVGPTPVPVPRGRAFVPADPTDISVCLYGPGESGVIRGSGRLTAAAASGLAALLNATPAGRNADSPESVCRHEPQVWPDLVLLIRAGGPTTTVWISYTQCNGRGMDNGTHVAQVTLRVLDAVHDLLRKGYGTSGELPA